MINMEKNEIIINKPKNRTTALNRGAYFINQKEQIEVRRVNLMKNIQDTELKLKRLEETLQGYKNQIERLSSLDQNLDIQIENLQKEFELTYSDILIIRSSLLTAQIEKLRSQADIHLSGKKEQF